MTNYSSISTFDLQDQGYANLDELITALEAKKIIDDVKKPGLLALEIQHSYFRA